MFTFRSNIVSPLEYSIEYLFKTRWKKSFIDSDKNHNYGGFTSLLKTESGDVINTGNYCARDAGLIKVDNELTEIIGSKTQGHYINLLPMSEVGEHYDIYDATDDSVGNPSGEFCNTSILYPVFGEILIESDRKKKWLQPNVFTVIETSKLHNGWNQSKQLVWCSSSLVYGLTYAEVKSTLWEYIVTDLD